MPPRSRAASPPVAAAAGSRALPAALSLSGPAPTARLAAAAAGPRCACEPTALFASCRAAGAPADAACDEDEKEEEKEDEEEPADAGSGAATARSAAATQSAASEAAGGVAGGVGAAAAPRPRLLAGAGGATLRAEAASAPAPGAASAGPPSPAPAGSELRPHSASRPRRSARYSAGCSTAKHRSSSSLWRAGAEGRQAPVRGRSAAARRQARWRRAALATCFGAGRVAAERSSAGPITSKHMRGASLMLGASFLCSLSVPGALQYAALGSRYCSRAVRCRPRSAATMTLTRRHRPAGAKGGCGGRARARTLSAKHAQPLRKPRGTGGPARAVKEREGGRAPSAQTCPAAPRASTRPAASRSRPRAACPAAARTPARRAAARSRPSPQADRRGCTSLAVAARASPQRTAAGRDRQGAPRGRAWAVAEQARSFSFDQNRAVKQAI